MSGLSLNEKFDRLKEVIHDMQSIVVAFSGGLDSVLLLKAALTVLPTSKVLSVTAFSSIFSPESIKKTSNLAHQMRAPHLLVQTNEMSNPEFLKNGPDRCYYCKCELFYQLKMAAENKKLKHIVDAINLTDFEAKRGNLRAFKEYDIRMPLVEAAISREDVQKICEAISLPGKDEGKTHCLASRFSQNVQINEDRLFAIYNSEKWLREKGFHHVIIQHHLEDMACIKLSTDQKSDFLDPSLAGTAISKLKEFGYRHVVLDLE